ncbi:MAG: hypothetical protein Q8K92_23200 [Leadbetterella sp.]|nr:hypothetical protein [Leadbetterella sp.]
MTTPNIKTYKITSECSQCGHQEEIEVSKREAAFELVDVNTILGQSCKKCSSTKFSTSYQRPDLDSELLKEWATSQELFLMPQDEELLLADGNYVNAILNILDTVSIPDQKRNLLMAALCVIVYDNSIDDNSQQDNELKKRVINELNLRQDKLKLADDWIMDYIKDVVYPQLDLERKNAV